MKNHACAAAAIVPASWTGTALAALPPGAESGIQRIGTIALTFLAVAIVFAIVGAVTARKLAPKSKSSRDLIMAVSNVTGAIAGYLVIKAFYL